MLKNSEKGVSLIITFFILTIILAIVLGISIILYSQIKIIRNIGNSVVAFYAAESGVEKTLYHDRKEIPENGTRGICNICQVCSNCNPGPNNSAGDCNESNCQGCTSAGTDCASESCKNCEISFNTYFGDKNYNIEAIIAPSGEFSITTIESKGAYKDTRRAIELKIAKEEVVGGGCTQNSDCGTDGPIGESFCQNGDLYQHYVTYTCSNSTCSSSYYDQLVQRCSESCPNIWLCGWPYRKKITISKTNVDADLADFPLYVKLSGDSDIGAYSRSDGHDIRFTGSDGVTLLSYERESWTGGGGSSVTADFWVKVPTVATAANTDIYIYYGKSDATDGQDAANVWDSNFKAVWHLPNGSTLTANDSTSGGNTGTAYNVTATTSGKIDGAANYVDATVYRRITIGSPSTALQNIGTGDYTFETWVNPSSYVLYSYLVSMNGYGLVETKNTKYGIVNAKNVAAVSAASVTAGLTHVVGVKSGTSYNFYINGAVSNGTFASDTGYNLYYTIGGGWNASTTYAFQGVLDEVRISNTARSAAWIKFEYYNMNSASNELTFGSQEIK
jgi:Tfp pilus assembly protein PilX